jgi:hypothetical protein
MTETSSRQLDRIILRVLSYHTGTENAVPFPDFLETLAYQGFHMNEKFCRVVINQLRLKGHPICSIDPVDQPKSYYLAADWQELLEFIEREIHPRIQVLTEMDQAMRLTAERAWGPPIIQPSLFPTKAD